MKHNLSDTRIYRIYSNMKQRCFNKDNPSYYLYGGRGIKITPLWLGDNGFSQFFEWSINNGYTETMTIDRINPDKDYSPENCRWVTRSENSSSVTLRNGRIETQPFLEQYKATHNGNRPSSAVKYKYNKKAYKAFNVQIKPEIFDRIDRYCKENNISRSQFLLAAINTLSPDEEVKD